MVLTEERMRHIVDRHVMLDGHELAIKRAVEDADTTCRGNVPGSEVHWRSNVGPAAWLAVVVAYDEQKRGTIRTAYPSRKPPKEENRL